jgi:hypothetical protein
VEDIPEDWFSRQDYQIENNISEAHAIRHISFLLRTNKIEKKSFHKMTDSGFCRLIPHYRLKS